MTERKICDNRGEIAAKILGEALKKFHLSGRGGIYSTSMKLLYFPSSFMMPSIYFLLSLSRFYFECRVVVVSKANDRWRACDSTSGAQI